MTKPEIPFWPPERTVPTVTDTVTIRSTKQCNLMHQAASRTGQLCPLPPMTNPALDEDDG